MLRTTAAHHHLQTPKPAQCTVVGSIHLSMRGPFNCCRKKSNAINVSTRLRNRNVQVMGCGVRLGCEMIPCGLSLKHRPWMIDLSASPRTLAIRSGTTEHWYEPEFLCACLHACILGSSFAGVHTCKYCIWIFDLGGLAGCCRCRNV